MNYYKVVQLDRFHDEKFCFIEIHEKNEIFEILLNRPAKKNAIHPQMLNELALHFNMLKKIKKLGF